MQPDWNHPEANGTDQRKEKLDYAFQLIGQSSDKQAGLDKLVALSMRTGYELGKQAKN